MLSCKEVARLVSESLDHKLSFWQRVRLKLHLKACHVCAEYSKQMDLLFSALRRHIDKVSPQQGLDETVKDEMKEVIRSKDVGG